MIWAGKIVKSGEPPFGFGATPELIPPGATRDWLVHESPGLLAFNKPGWVVCHPAKNGPRSALATAVAEDFYLPTPHLVHRLDRETTGLVVFARDEPTARLVQMALQERRIGKRYLAILEGELARAVTVEEPLGPDRESVVRIKQKARRRGTPCITHFAPLAVAGGFTLADIHTETGRKHQIRAHAQWLEHPLVGDKLYGSDERLYLSFIEHGWTPAHADALALPHHALHAAAIILPPGLLDEAPDGLTLQAPVGEWMGRFLDGIMGLPDLSALGPVDGKA